MPANSEKAFMGLYDLAWKAASPLLSRNKRLAEGIEQRKLKERLPKADVWIQAASAGESYLARSIIKGMNPSSPLRVLATSNTSQGMGILNEAFARNGNDNGNIGVSTAYFPFDAPSVMKRAVHDVTPSVMVLLESEIWPGLLASLKKTDCKILLINGRMTQKSLERYLIWPSFWKRLAPDLALAVSREDARRFSVLFGKDNVSGMSNVKFDQIGPAVVRKETAEAVERLVGGTSFLALASVRKEEEPLIDRMIERILQKAPNTVIGLFPRHMHRLPRWREALAGTGRKWRNRSEAEKPAVGGEIVLWDAFGELIAAYRFAKAVFVGGSLAPLGGQNFLEPLACGVIPVSGPSWFNFHWVGREIMDSGLVRVASGWKESADALIGILQESRPREEIRRAAMAYIDKRRGGTRTAVRAIEDCLRKTKRNFTCQEFG